MSRRFIYISFMAMATLAISSSAWAQPASIAAPPTATPAAYQGHAGIMVGVGLGLSMATCGECDGDSETSVGLDFNIGGFLNPRLALMYDVAMWVDSEDGATLILGANTAAAQYWVAPKVWIKGGLGISQIRLSYDGDSDSETGLAMTGAAGFELMQNPGFAIDISGRLSHLDFDGGSFQLLNIIVGARWK